MTGADLYDFIRKDDELIGILRKSVLFDVAKRKGGRKGSAEKRATNMLRRFWASIDGATFRLLLEQKLGGERACAAMRGGSARIKSVMTLLVDAILNSAGY